MVDRNNYYGAESASLSLNNLFEKFRPGAAVPNLGRAQDWNVDLVPKFIMSTGNLVKILLHTKVTRYLEWKNVDGSYVFKDKKIEKVPSTPAEALSSPLMSFFQKRYFRSFLIFIDKYERSQPSTWMKGKPCDQWTMRDVYSYYELVEETQQFVGHAMALQRDDTYLDQPAEVTVDAIKLYMDSMQRFENCKSPYIYPLYGLGGLPEGFSRLCAINGGTFMLNKGKSFFSHDPPVPPSNTFFAYVIIQMSTKSSTTRQAKPGASRLATRSPRRRSLSETHRTSELTRHVRQARSSAQSASLITPSPTRTAQKVCRSSSLLLRSSARMTSMYA